MALVFVGFFAPGAQAAKEKKLLFLVARNQVHDPFFEKSVVLMLPLEGTPIEVGLIINKTSNVSIGKIFPHTPALAGRKELVHFGGPVDVTVPGLIFHSTTVPRHALHLYGDVYFTFDSDLVAPLLEDAKPSSKTVFFLGRAQWSPEQLQNEIHRGDWYEVHEDGDLVFNSDPHTIWRRLHDLKAQTKSIRNDRPSNPSGHAREAAR